MSGSDLAAVVLACAATGIVGALAVVLVQARRTLRAARDSLEAVRAETSAAVEELRAATRRAGFQLDRIDALYGTAEAISNGADSASRLAYKTVSNPVVKAIAFGSGTRRALHRLRREPPK